MSCNCKNNEFGGYWIANGTYMCCNKGLKKYGMIDMSNMMNKYMLGEYGANSRYATMNKDLNDYTTPPTIKDINVIESFTWTDNIRPDYTNWYSDAKDKLLELMQLLGDPDTIDRRRGGNAEWSKTSLNMRGICLDGVSINDKNGDNIRIEINYKVEDSKRNDLKLINENIMYTNKIVLIDSDSLLKCLVILNYIIMFNKDMISYGDAKRSITASLKANKSITTLLTNVCFMLRN